MRRILVVLLAVCFLAQSVAFAANYTDVPDDAKYKAAIEVLGNLGILTEQGGSAVDFNPDKNITRGDYIQAIVKMRGIDTKTITIDRYSFSDVTAQNPLAGSIYTAVHLGLVSGYANNTFKPDETIPLSQAVKILVTALGYKVNAENSGGDPVGYFSEAQRLKLFKGIEMKNDDVLKRSEAALLLYNALDVDIMKQVSAGDRITYTVNDGENVLTQYLKCGVVKDIVVQTHNTTLTDPIRAVAKDEVVIGNTMYKTGNTNADSYLGYRVKAYYKEDNDSKSLFYLTPYQTEVVEVDAENIFSYSNHTLSYWINKDEDKNVTKLKVSSKADVIYNGKAWPEFVETDMLLINDGYITLVDNDSDDIYDVVLITAYEDYVVNSINFNDKAIYPKYPVNGKERLDLSDVMDEDLTVVDASSKPQKFNIISKNDVLTVMQSRDGKLVKIIVCREQLKGEITEKKDTGNVEIDYLPQKIVISYQQLFNNLDIGYKGTFFLDSRGKIAGVDSITSNLAQYGYLKRVAKTRGIKPTVEVKIFTIEGTMEEFAVDDRLIIDGISGRTDQQFYETFTTEGQNRRYTKQQLVKYIVDENKILQSINTETLGQGEDPSENITSLDCSKTNYLSGTMVFSTKVLLTSKALVFRVPVLTAEGDSFSDDAYGIGEPAFADSTSYDNVTAYDIDDGGISDILVMREPYSGGAEIGGGSANAPQGGVDVMVDKVTTAVNAVGETISKLYFIEKGNTLSLTAKNANTFKKNVIINGITTAVPLQRGDIIRYKKNSNNEVLGITVDFDINQTTYKCDSDKEVGKAFGVVYSQKNGGIKVMADAPDSSTILRVKDPNGTELSADPTHLYAYAAFRVTITVYDRKNGIVRAGSLRDVISYKEDPRKASKVFIHSKWNEIREMFVIK